MENSLGFSAVGWVHYRIAGGLRQILTIAAVYAAILIGLTAFTVHMMGARAAGFYATASGLVLVLQAFVLLVFGVYRVAGSIRMDLTTNMIESHRLMPLRPSHAILGYIIGATTQTWALAIVNLIISLGLGVRGGVDFSGLLTAHGMLVIFALFIWTITAMSAIIARAFVGAVTFAPILFMMTQGTLLAVLPGLLLLTAPALGETIMSPNGRKITFDHVLSLGGQASLGVLFFAAAARRYRRPDTPALLPSMGLAILAVWVIVSLAGMGRPLSVVLASAFGGDGAPLHGQLIASMIAAMLLMIPVVCNAGWFAVFARRHRSEVSPVRREVAAAIALSLAVVLGLSLTRGLRESRGMFEFTYNDVLRTATMGISLAGFVLGLHFVSRIAYRGKAQRGAAIAFLWLAITWLAPFLVDLVLNAVRQPDEFEFGFSTTLSPVGTVTIAFGRWLGGLPTVSPVPGAVLQLCVGLAMAGMYFGTGRGGSKAGAGGMRGELSAAPK